MIACIRFVVRVNYSVFHLIIRLNFDEFEIVDFWDDDVDAEQLEEIQSKLIDMMQIAGLYFKSQPIELS